MVTGYCCGRAKWLCFNMVLLFRGVGTAPAGTAMAVPLFHKKINYSEKKQLGAIPAASSTQVSRRTRSSGSSSIDTHEQTPVRARLRNVYVTYL